MYLFYGITCGIYHFLDNALNCLDNALNCLEIMDGIVFEAPEISIYSIERDARLGYLLLNCKEIKRNKDFPINLL